MKTRIAKKDDIVGPEKCSCCFRPMNEIDVPERKRLERIGHVTIERLESKGWTINMWHNIHWCLELVNGYMALHVHVERDGKVKYHCMISDQQPPSGTPCEWLNDCDSEDPNEAVEKAVEVLRESFAKTLGIYREVESTVSSVLDEERGTSLAQTRRELTCVRKNDVRGTPGMTLFYTKVHGYHFGLNPVEAHALYLNLEQALFPAAKIRSRKRS